MTKSSAADVDWVRSTILGAALGGAFWAVVMRFIVAEGAPPAGTLLGAAALVSIVIIGIGALVYRLTSRTTVGVGIALAPLTGWVAILIYIIV